MVKLRTDGEQWLKNLAKERSADEIELLQQGLALIQMSAEETTVTGHSCYQYGLATADILVSLNMDINTVVAGLIYPTVQYTDLNNEDLSEALGSDVAKLIDGVQRMDSMRVWRNQYSPSGKSPLQVDNLRKMLLAMVEDVRVVLIKLAERTTLMQCLRDLDPGKQREIAEETQDIYAPLANKLGMGQIKWVLEDLAFRYLHPETYREIASLLDQKRTDRENYIQYIIDELKESLHKAGVHQFEITGRAKHIYSIYRKMQRKGGDFNKLYDIIAVRVLVPTIENCYAVVGLVHSLWTPIPEEFDDYIARPKNNGYRSIHTAVFGANDRKFEVQIRTYDMHQEAELGVAAHWIYKEGNRQLTSYDQKITWLRQVIDWHKDVIEIHEATDKPKMHIFEDMVYVFTPTGEIIDLPQGSTPLDFAYSIHTEIGNRCRGAKINGNIVPLTYSLKTGDQVEILTAKQPAPSRDWLSASAGYLKSSRAKAKVHQWFKKQDYERNVAEGRDYFEKEFKRVSFEIPNLEELAAQYHFKNPDDMFAAIGNGDLRLGQIIHTLESQKLQTEAEEEKLIFPIIAKKKRIEKNIKGISIQGVGDLLTQLANCCKPVPGDAIVGFITHGRGVSIHHPDCPNILNISEKQKDRLVEVEWGEELGHFPVDIFIEAFDRHGLVRDITTLISNEKINVAGLNTVTDKREQRARLVVTLEISNLVLLNKLVERIKQLPDIIHVERLKASGG